MQGRSAVGQALWDVPHHHIRDGDTACHREAVDGRANSCRRHADQSHTGITARAGRQHRKCGWKRKDVWNKEDELSNCWGARLRVQPDTQSFAVTWQHCVGHRNFFFLNRRMIYRTHLPRWRKSQSKSNSNNTKMHTAICIECINTFRSDTNR